MTKLIFIALLSLCIATEARAGCPDQLRLRNQSLEQKGPARFESRNGEYSFMLPFKKQQVEMGSFGNPCLYAHNIDAIGEPGHLSVEWVLRDDAISDDDFAKYWEQILPDYLAGNFGNGKYELLEKRVYVDATGRKAISFAATGTHNTGEPGSIVGIVSNFSVRMAVAYQILPTVPDKAAPVRPELYAKVTSLSESITCSKSTCRK